MPEYINYDDPPPPPWWREPLIEAGLTLAILAVLVVVLYAMAAVGGAL